MNCTNPASLILSLTLQPVGHESVIHLTHSSDRAPTRDFGSSTLLSSITLIVSRTQKRRFQIETPPDQTSPKPGSTDRILIYMIETTITRHLRVPVSEISRVSCPYRCSRKPSLSRSAHHRPLSTRSRNWNQNEAEARGTVTWHCGLAHKAHNLEVPGSIPGAATK